MSLVIRPRADWDAAPPVSTIKVAARRRSELVVHHTTGETLGQGTTPEWLRSIQQYHQHSKGWADIGYHFLVDQAGEVWEGRGWDVVGAHAPDHNTSGIGIAYLGDGREVMPRAALLALRAFRALTTERYGRELTLLRHSDVKATACPGTVLSAWVAGGMPAPGSSAPALEQTPAASSPSRPASAAPPFPLPPTFYFGPRAGGRKSISGTVSYRGALEPWQARMVERGWRLEVDGKWGPETEGVTRSFQREKGLVIDGHIGAITWAAAWTTEVTR